MTRVLGIDPGLNSTGIVLLQVHRDVPGIVSVHGVVDGRDPNFFNSLYDTLLDVVGSLPIDAIFIEGYQSRGKAHSNQPKMQQAVQYILDAIFAVDRQNQNMPTPRIIPNQGVKQVVTSDMMKLWGLWNFSTPSYHQDLRSAARIALYGMIKDDEYNSILTDNLIETLQEKGLMP